MKHVTYRCFLCGISWPNNQAYATCPVCGETTKRLHFEDGVDTPLTEAEAKDLLVERGLKPHVTGTGIAPTPRSGLLSKFTLQRELEQLHTDIEHWAKEAPPWARR